MSENSLKEIRERRNISRDRLADMVGTTRQQIMRLEKGERKLTKEWAERIAPKLGVDASDIMFGPEHLAPDYMDDDYETPVAMELSPAIPEFDVFAALGGGAIIDTISGEREAVKANWHMPMPFLRHELNASPRNLCLISVQGDSMEPTLSSGDRVIIDMSQKIPSPPGLFVVNDGLGVVAKRVEHIPGSDPVAIRIIADNPRHSTYERTLDEAFIIGRILGRWQRL